MNLQFVCVLKLVFVIQTSVNAKLIFNSWNNSPLRQLQNKCDFTSQPQCTSDCSSILVCSAGNETPINSTKCTSHAPFCEKGVCSTFPGNCFFKKNSIRFICTSAGIFPEPTDCSRYHYCSTANSTSIQYECPSGNIYNSKLKICQKGVPRNIKSSRRICEKISCNNIKNEFIIFPANQAYYVYCHVSASGFQQIFMYKCESEESYFDANTRKCSFNCQSAGYFPDSTDCSSYYICDGHKKYTPRRVSCPHGYYFNGTACINSAANCPPGSLSVATISPSAQLPTSQTQAQTSSTQPSTVLTETPTETAAQFIQTSTTEASTQSSTDLTTETEQEALEPILIVPYPSILHLPCPMWIQNQQICSRIARLLSFLYNE